MRGIGCVNAYAVSLRCGGDDSIQRFGISQQGVAGLCVLVRKSHGFCCAQLGATKQYTESQPSFHIPEEKRQATAPPLPASEKVKPFVLIFADATSTSAMEAIKIAAEAAAAAECAAKSMAVKGAFVCGSADCKAADGYAGGYESHHDFLHCLLSFLF